MIYYKLNFKDSCYLPLKLPWNKHVELTEILSCITNKFHWLYPSRQNYRSSNMSCLMTPSMLFVTVNHMQKHYNKEKIKEYNIFFVNYLWFTPRRAIKIIMGDMNAKIGRGNVFRPSIGKESLHIVFNDNGTRFISFAMSRNIIISSTYFQRNDIYKRTCVSPNVTTKNQIDHVTIDKLHRSWFKNVRSYWGADGDTDNYLVVATLTEKLSVSWKKNRSRNKTNSIDLDRLKIQ